MCTWKKWIRILTISLLVSLLPLTVAKAKEGTVYEQFEKESPADQSEAKANPEPAKASVVPYALKFIGSFLLILFLLFIVLKYLSKKTKMYSGGGPFHALGGHSLGNNRSLQMVMVGDTLYLLGVGEDVNLIRTIPPGEEQRRLLESAAEKPIDTVTKWGSQLKKTSQEKWDELLLKQLKEVKSDSDQQKRGENG
ncbi:flagellar biosynthetic protein FliO [Neobacillus niacini]|uniref:flagellar biosynthetic protein FliO n=1 Tax=Neobacillus niacini TaxID=86668 RepID=UPI0005F042D0|nr:flagellar biosynthetic protein FliO [Neobacillus niacini]